MPQTYMATLRGWREVKGSLARDMVLKSCMPRLPSKVPTLCKACTQSQGLGLPRRGQGFRKSDLSLGEEALFNNYVNKKSHSGPEITPQMVLAVLVGQNPLLLPTADKGGGRRKKERRPVERGGGVWFALRERGESGANQIRKKVCGLHGILVSSETILLLFPWVGWPPQPWLAGKNVSACPRDSGEGPPTRPRCAKEVPRGKTSLGNGSPHVRLRRLYHVF